MEKMRDLDIEQFWIDDTAAHMENCFSKGAKQAALGIRMSHECFRDELGVDLDPWQPNPPELMRKYAIQYNDKAEKIIGKRIVSEDFNHLTNNLPKLKRIGEIYGGRYFYHAGTEYLEGSVQNSADLGKLLDKVENTDIIDFVFPSDWNSSVKTLYEKTGQKPEPRFFGRSVRGPCTLAASIIGTSNFIYFQYDEPELMQRFSDSIANVLFKINRAIDAACGYNEQNKPAGFGFNDDNCCITTPEFYESFGYPILKKIFDYYSPCADDFRYQHSDSDMGHLLPVLGRLNFTGVNFGPNVLVDQIRKYMPKTRIDGCLAPYTFMRNDSEEIFRQVKRDCKMAIESGTKGLNLSTAGSINPGSSLDSLRLVMQTIQNYGRY